MSIYDSPYYDEPRSWIQKRRAQNLDWETIRMAKKKSTRQKLRNYNNKNNSFKNNNIIKN